MKYVAVLALNERTFYYWMSDNFKGGDISEYKMNRFISNKDQTKYILVTRIDHSFGRIWDDRLIIDNFFDLRDAQRILDLVNSRMRKK